MSSFSCTQCWKIRVKNKSAYIFSQLTQSPNTFQNPQRYLSLSIQREWPRLWDDFPSNYWTPSNLVLINIPIRKPVRSYWDLQDKEKFEIEYLQQIWNNISNMPGKPIHPIVLCSALKAVRLFSRGKCKNISCGARFSLSAGDRLESCRFGRDSAGQAQLLDRIFREILSFFARTSETIDVLVSVSGIMTWNSLKIDIF